MNQPDNNMMESMVSHDGEQSFDGQQLQSGKKGRLVFLAHAAMLVAMSVFGGLNIIAKSALDTGVNPLIFCLYRDVPATIVLIATSCVVEGRAAQMPRSRYDVLLFMACGFSGIYVGQFLFIVGLKLTSANIAAIYQPLCPVFTVIIALIMRMETATWSKCLGIVLAVGGAVQMVGFHNLGGEGANSSLLGHICLLGNTFGAGIYFLFQKPLIARGYRPLMITGYGYGSGAVWVLLTSLYYVGQPEQWNLVKHTHANSTASNLAISPASDPSAGGSTAISDALTFFNSSFSIAVHLAPSSVTAVEATSRTATAMTAVTAVTAVTAGGGSETTTSYTALYALLYAVLLSSCTSFGLMTWANQYLDASVVALYCMVQPVATALLDLMIYGQHITPSEGVGALLIGAGLLLTTVKLGGEQAGRGLGRRVDTGVGGIEGRGSEASSESSSIARAADGKVAYARLTDPI